MSRMNLLSDFRWQCLPRWEKRLLWMWRHLSKCCDTVTQALSHLPWTSVRANTTWWYVFLLCSLIIYLIGDVNIGIIFYWIGNSQWCIYNTQSKSHWFNTQSRVLQANWLILENNEKATYYAPLFFICDHLLLVSVFLITQSSILCTFMRMQHLKSYQINSGCYFRA